MIRIKTSTQPVSKIAADLAVAIIDPSKNLASSDDREISRALAEAKRAFRSDSLSREHFVHFGARSRVKSLVVFYSGHEKSYDLREAAKIFAARALGYASDYEFTQIAFLLNTKAGAALADCVTEGLVLGDYRFDKYRSQSKTTKRTVTLACRAEDSGVVSSSLKRARIVSEQVNLARDLVNEPGDRMYPQTLASAAKRIASKGKLGVRVFSGAELEKHGYRGLLAVGKGSVYPPCLIVLRYRPARKKSDTHLALVGKGITFDTGGISIKPSEGMWMMKGDMAGGAAVLGAMAAIAQLKPDVAVTGIVAAAENFPGPKAQRPGDIFIAKNGKSVMVDNTDAEGRLVLTDALARAGEEKATHIVDAATLTGSVVRALGPAVAGIMGDDKDLVRQVIAAGAKHGEVFWELPLVEEYRRLLKTPYADLNNIGGKYAGAITAGLFLREFVPDGTAWAHLDIAGPFILEKKWKYYPAGATGFGVKTFVELAFSL